MKTISIISIISIISFLSFISNISTAQVVVVKDPSWQFDDQAKFMEARAQWSAEQAKWAESIAQNAERLQMLKDATRTLKEVNRRIVNINILEDAIVVTARTHEMTIEHIKRIERNQLFSVDEYVMITSMVQRCLSMTAYTIKQLTVVVTDNFAQMGDGERQQNLNIFLTKLQNDLEVIASLLWEIEKMENNLMHLRTTQYMKKALTPKKK